MITKWLNKIGRRKGQLTVAQRGADDGRNSRSCRGELAAVQALQQGEGRIGLAEQRGNRRPRPATGRRQEWRRRRAADGNKRAG